MIYEENMKLEKKDEKAQKQIDEYNRLNVKTVKDLGNRIEIYAKDVHYCNCAFEDSK